MGLGLILAAFTSLPQAQTAAIKAYPDKQVRLVIPFPPGGATDVIGRIMAQELSKSLNQQVVADNRAGDSGNIGADMVAKAPADGYTLLMGALTSHAINSNLEKGSIKYDLEKDFTPVAVVGVVPLVFVVNPSVPVKNMKEFIAYAKANPGKLTFASSGAGAPQRLAMEMFRFQLGLDLLHVPYKGSGPAMTDLGRRPSIEHVRDCSCGLTVYSIRSVKASCCHNRKTHQPTTRRTNCYSGYRLA